MPVLTAFYDYILFVSSEGPCLTNPLPSVAYNLMMFPYIGSSSSIFAHYSSFMFPWINFYIHYWSTALAFQWWWVERKETQVRYLYWI